MKILLLDKEAKYRNGVVVYNQRLFNYLKSHGHTVYIARWSNSKNPSNDITYLPYYLGLEKFYIVLIPKPESLKKITSLIRSMKPDILYTNLGLSTFDSMIAGICHKENIPIGGILHMDAGENKNIYQYLLKIAWIYMRLTGLNNFDFINVFSHRVKNFFVKIGIDEEKIEVIPNGIDSTVFTPGESDFGKKHDIIKGVLFMGRLSFQKNPEFLIKSFLKVNPDKNTKLVLVGGGEMYNELSGKYKDERIIFTGFVESDKERVDIIRSCQIFSLASRAEGISLSLLETMSCGLMPIVSDVGASKYVVADTGISIAVNDLEEEFPKELEKYLKEQGHANILGKKARKRVLKRYSLETSSKMLINALKKHSAFFYSKAIKNHYPA